MFSYAKHIVTEIDNDASIKTRDDAIRALRRIGFSDFGLLLLNMPSPAFPKLSTLLPAMAPQEIQENWTGSSGEALLVQSLAFVNTIAFHYSRLTGKSIRTANVLDYGCGYGRLARLMYYMIDTNALVGVDPWDESIKQCKSANLGDEFYLSDYLPESLPVGERKFDLAYAFSVFSHTSRRATLTALSAVRRHMEKDSIFVVTIRPIEYWRHTMQNNQTELCKSLERDHVKNGFAFNPHGREPVDGDITYGDTSISLEWLDSNLENWKVVGIDRSLFDPFQIVVCLSAT